MSRTQNEKLKRGLELIKDAEECKSKHISRVNNISDNNQFVKPIYEASKSIKHAKNEIVNKLFGKHTHKIYQNLVVFLND